ncbi:MAG: hypothetical protein ACFHVJ_14915 [Aestuariibacter sp.]
MEDILGIFGEILKGFFRAIGYLIAEVFFKTICFWVGWPLCKIITLGSYPRPRQRITLNDEINSEFWCSFLGMIILLACGIYYVINIA